MSDIAENSTQPTGSSTVYELIKAQELRDPDAMAMLEPGCTALTYRWLCEQIEYVVGSLNSVGIGRNDRVALVLPNGATMAVAFLATAAATTSVPLSPHCTEAELNSYLAKLHARALVVESGKASPARAAAALQKIPVIELLPMPQIGAGAFTLDAGKVDSASPPTPAYAEAGDIALILHTSGTTSRPKIVPLSHSNLCASAQHVSSALQLTERDRCLNIMPLFHAHGLIAAVLASLAAGGSVVCAPGFSPSQFFEWLSEFFPTWVTAVPTIYQALLGQASDNREVIARCPIRFIRSATSALPPEVMRKLESVFHVPVIESYGMTETATQITSNPLPPQQRKPGSAGLAAGPEVAIRGVDGAWLSSGQSGEIVVRGPNLMCAYESAPKANQSAFVDGWFRTGDQGYLDSEGYLYITGRLKEMINRGGEKVFPREVDDVLLQHPGVSEAAAFSVPHRTLGEDIIAAVVSRDDARITPKVIRDFAIERLTPFKVPSQVLIVDTIPKTASGKINRLSLGEQYAGKLKSMFVAPRNELEAFLLDVYKEVLGLAEVGIHDNFFSLGGDSLGSAQVIHRVNAACELELDITVPLKYPSVSELAQHIGGRTKQLSSDMKS